MVINLTKTTIKSTVRPLGGNLFEGKIKKYFYKEIIKEKFWSLRTDGRVEKNARKTSVLGGGSTVLEKGGEHLLPPIRYIKFLTSPKVHYRNTSVCD